MPNTTTTTDERAGLSIHAALLIDKLLESEARTAAGNDAILAGLAREELVGIPLTDYGQDTPVVVGSIDELGRERLQEIADEA